MIKTKVLGGSPGEVERDTNAFLSGIKDSDVIDVYPMVVKGGSLYVMVVYSG
jgi:hypothetical protein